MGSSAPDHPGAGRATFAALRAGFRRGTPERWGKAERDNAERAFAIMAKFGGEALVDPVPACSRGCSGRM